MGTTFIFVILVVLFWASFFWYNCFFNRQAQQRREFELQEVVRRPVNHDLPLQIIRSASEDLEQCNKQLADIPVTIYNKLPLSSSSCSPDDTTSTSICTGTSESNGGGGDQDGEVCVICLEEYEDGEKVRSLPTCRHMFHQECIDPWLVKSSSFCPVCRIRVIQRAVEPQNIHWINIDS
ncbi:hypothetical protein J5N97_005869 [Dioscorea zingiberensis]|uniref:RING-type E3 ubiquitin transferase n=1 Tax=Dioscorea zingiberensis TaxID=325984 RepID=A0A9D5HSR5_9LILI|nr:hypothetical protein J5N97_005869 [Dioscorea zingiberensis]